MIDHYDFGEITINGKQYTRDLIIYPDRVVDGWWRKEGHKLGVEDLKTVFEAKPEVLIVGTGYSGLMKVSNEVKERLKSENVELIVEGTRDACNAYNRLAPTKRVVAAFHLTC